MKLFRRLVSHKAAPAPLPLDPDLLRLFDAHGLAAFDRQLRFAELVGERAWRLDQEHGTLAFGEDIVLPAQVLGSLATVSSTWLWAWANPSVDSHLSSKARQLREFGEHNGVPVLTEPEVPSDKIGDSHTIGVISVGVLVADAYYRCPYPGGEAVVIVEVPDWPPRSSEAPEARLISVVSAAQRALSVPVSAAGVEAFARTLGLSVSTTAAEVRAGTAAVRFDPAGRISALGVGSEVRPARSLPSGGVTGGPRALRLARWTDPAIEASPGWRDTRGLSPVDVVQTYLERRHEWDRKSIRALAFTGPDDPKRKAAMDALSTLHADLSTGSGLAGRDTSGSTLPDRDPRKTSLVEVRRESPDRVVLITAEDDHLGLLPPQRYDLTAVRVEGEWRLDDRVAVYESGERIEGLL